MKNTLIAFVLALVFAAPAAAQVIITPQTPGTTITWPVNAPANGQLVFPAMTPGGVSGIYAGTTTLVRIFQPALAAGGQSDGLNVFVGGAGNSTMTNGAGATHLASYNTAIGSVSLTNNTTGYFNVAFGASSLYTNTTGSGNAAVGTYSLLANTTGGWNVAVGTYSLQANTTGSNNAAFGTDSLRSNTTGSNNAAFGYASMYANTTGYGNAAVGSDSLYANVGGVGNVAVGLDAGRYIADGATGNTAPTGGTYLGNGTRALADTETGAIVIGYNAIGAGTNTASIGNSSVLALHFGSTTLNTGSGTLSIKKVQTATTMSSGTITVTSATTAIPAGSFVLGVTCRVTTAITGAGLGSWSVGIAGTTTKWGTTLALALNTQSTIVNYLAGTVPYYNISAAGIVFTGNAGIFSTGVVSCTTYYIDFTNIPTV